MSAARVLVLPLLCWLLATASSEASWLSEITGVDINVPAGTMTVSRPRPEAIPEMIRNLPKDAATFFLNPHGPQLALLIRQAHAQALGTSVSMPADMRARLSPFFPPRVLDSAKFTTRAQSGVSLSRATLETVGSVGAMTVDNVIVFDDDVQARSVLMWAHELVHVGQYQNLGVEGFAALYAGPGAAALEKEAYDWADHVNAKLSSGAALTMEWRDTRTTSTSQITWSDFHQAARSVVPPENCAAWRQVGPGAIEVTNICPVGLAITAVNVAGVRTPCNGPVCFYPAGTTHVMTGAPGPVYGVWFDFR